MSFNRPLGLSLLSLFLAIAVMISPMLAAEGNLPQVEIRRVSDPVIDVGAQGLSNLIVENETASDVTLNIDWALQRNSNMVEELPPHPVLGLDHAANSRSKVMIDGKNAGDSLLTDNNDYTAFETPWGKGYREAIVDIDLGQVRSIASIQWLAADANWIWFSDLSVSLDNKTYIPVESIQHFDMHQKWGRNVFPLSNTIEARHLRFRFHKDNDDVNVIRLPAGIMVYDGIENDRITIPTSGETIASGSVSTKVSANGKEVVELPRPVLLQPGSYLLSRTETIGKATRKTWEQLLVKPKEPIDRTRTKRCGINVSEIRFADSMAECGFGWVRFENAKWEMYCDAPDHFGFDGSIAPWHVNQDEIYRCYHSRDMSVLPYVFQTPEWATSAGRDVKQNRAGYPPKNNADYGEAIFQLVARYGKRRITSELLKSSDKKTGLNQIQAVELWNEPNLVGPAWAPFVGSLDQYFEVMRAGVEGSRRADPDLPVSSAGWAGTNLEVVEKMSEYRYADGKRPIDLVDIVNVHFYSGRDNPEVCRTDPNLRRNDDNFRDPDFPDQLRDLIRWRNEHNSKAQIWLTETGNDVGGPIGLSERAQAAKLPRVMMIALASGIDKVFIYRESGSNPSMHAGAGLLRNDGTVRPAWVTTANTIRQLHGFAGPAIRIPHSDPNVWLLAWQDDQRVIVAAWTIGKPCKLNQPSEFQFAATDTTKIVDAFGYSWEHDKIKEGLNEPLTEFPIYLHIRLGTPTSAKIRQPH